MNPTRLLAVAFACLIANPAFAANKLYVSEFAVLGGANNGIPQIAALPTVTDQTPVDFSGGAASSAAFAGQTRYIRALCDSRCSIKLRPGCTGSQAAITNLPMGADGAEYFGVQPGDCLSAVANP